MPQLNDNQTRELNRAGKLLKFCNTGAPVDIKSIWIGYLPFKGQVDALTGFVGSIIPLTGQKELSSIGTTEGKKELKEDFASAADLLFSVTRGYARITNNDTLFAKVAMSESDILKLKDTEILGFANGMRTNIFTDGLLADAGFTPYGIILAMVTDAIGVATNFNATIGAAKATIIISNEANDQINGIVVKMRIAVSNMLDLSAFFKNTNPQFIADLAKAARRDDIGVHHTGANAFLSVGGVASKEGSVSIGTKTVVPNLLGECPPITCLPGDREVTAKMPGKADKVVVHHFIRGQMDDLVFDF